MSKSGRKVWNICEKCLPLPPLQARKSRVQKLVFSQMSLPRQIRTIICEIFTKPTCLIFSACQVFACRKLRSLTSKNKGICEKMDLRQVSRCVRKVYTSRRLRPKMVKGLIPKLFLRLSITTRIKTFLLYAERTEMFTSYGFPLQQGLRQRRQS